MPDLAHYENLREQLVEQEYERLLHEALTDTSAFESLDSGYEICTVNSGQIQRALRNLDDAIKGKEYALREIERNGLTVAKIVEVSGSQYIVAKNGSLHKIGRKPAQTL